MIPPASSRMFPVINFKSLSLACCVISSFNLFGAPPTVAPTKADVPYGPDPSKHQVMDIYVPSQGKGPFPVVIWYGGIWSPGKGAPINNFLPRGVASIAAETRTMTDGIKEKLSPPISVVQLDARRAVQFVRLHAAEWNLDPQRIAVAGGSQGTLPALYVGCSGEKGDSEISRSGRTGFDQGGMCWCLAESAEH